VELVCSPSGYEPGGSADIGPFLPDPYCAGIQPDDAWCRAAELIAVPPLDSAVPLQMPFASLLTPAVAGECATQAPPISYRAAKPTALPAQMPVSPSQAAKAWRDGAARLPAGAATFQQVYALAQQHARCLAADAARPDIPLLELRSMAAAAAACFRRAEEEAVAEPTLALLVADMSGIQSYLFEVSKVGAGGVARSLRARSFFLSQVTSLFARRLLELAALGPANLILDAGGKFYILLPATPGVETAIGQARAEAAQWGLDTMQGELALNVALATFPPDDLREGCFSSVWASAEELLATGKRRRLAHALLDDGRWRAEAFLRPVAFAGVGPCRACGRFAQATNEEKCSWCLADERRGRKITRAQWVAYDRAQAGTDDIAAFGWRARVGRGAPPSNSSQVLFLDAAETPGDAPYRFVARHVPTDADGAPITFEDIAAQAQGRPYLGFLKADVDRLGERMTLGLCRDDGPSLDSPARVAALGGALEEFFSGRLERLMCDAFPFCYVVYSGGDDLTVVGPHDAILRLALRVTADFRAYLGYPPGATRATDVLTLSAGITFAPCRRPVSVAVKLAERALNAAKDAGRARLQLFGRSMTWEAAHALYERLWSPDGNPTDLGAELLDSRRAPSAFLYHLLRYARMWEGYVGGDASCLRYQPLLAYEIARNVDAKALPHTHGWASRLAGLPLGAGATEWREEMDTLAVLARIVLLHRGDRDA